MAEHVVALGLFHTKLKKKSRFIKREADRLYLQTHTFILFQAAKQQSSTVYLHFPADRRRRLEQEEADLPAHHPVFLPPLREQKNLHFISETVTA